MNSDLQHSAVAILGVPFDHVTMGEAVTRIERMILSRKAHYVVTANMDFLVQARSDIELRKILFDADLVLCDGTPLVWASRLVGNPLPERVAGSDLVPELLGIAARRHYRVFFLGSAPEAAREATERMAIRYPGLVIAGHYSPPFNHLLEMDHEEIRERVRITKPDLLLISFGCPKQEKWIGMHFRTLGVPVTIGVGATIDFLAGRVRRAPAWMQRSGMEWLFRLAQEPRRLFRRYAKDLAVFSIEFLVQWWVLGRNASNAGHGRASVQDGCLSFEGALTRSSLEGKGTLVAEAMAHGLLDTRRVTAIDSTGMALLMRLQRQADRQSNDLVWLGPGPVVSRALRALRLQDFFTFAPDTNAVQPLHCRLNRERVAPVRQLGAEGSSLAWEGEITALNAAAVWEATRDHFLASPAGRPWILDLGGVRFLDSSGLGAVIRAKNLALKSGTDLRLSGVPGAVRNVLCLARLESFLLNGQNAKSSSHLASNSQHSCDASKNGMEDRRTQVC